MKTWKHRAMLSLIIQISEFYWGVKWYNNIEYILWDEIANPTLGDLRLICRVQLEDLKEMSEEINGWITYDSKNGVVPISMEEWNEKFQAWKKEDVVT